MYLGFLCFFFSLLGLINSVQPTPKVYNLQNHMKIFTFNQESFVICSDMVVYRDWPYMIFGNILINIGLKTTVNFGSLEPSYKVHTDWTEQLDAKPLKLDEDDSGFSDASVSNNLHDKMNKIMFSNNSRVFLTLSPITKTCFMIFDIKPNYMDSGYLEIHSNLEFDRSRLILSVVGLLMLICSESIANSILFYYISGTSIVLFCSIILVLIVLIKMMPMRRAGAVLQSVVFLFSGTLGLTFFFIDYLRSVVVRVVVSKWEFVFGYVLIVSVCSLVILYWLRIPDRLVTNFPRTKIVTTLFFRVVGSLLFVYSMRLPSISSSNNDSSTLFKHYLPFSCSFDILNKYPETFLRSFLVVFVNILFKIVQSSLKYSSLKLKHASQMPIEHHINRAPNAPRHCMAGSPCAASSPYHHAFGFSDQKDSHLGIFTPFGNRSFVKNSHSEYRGCNPWIPEPCSINRRQSDGSRRDSQHLHKNEILTDDED
ncbi:unnamed protein product [Schistosoma spindalis]|nr:unnamed protein product [Schistosoma spindale]